MEQLQYFLPIITAILGFLFCYLFRKPKIVEITKFVEVKVRVNQCQVAEVVTEELGQYILAWDYFNRKQVITKRYNVGTLNSYKNGDIFEYTGDSQKAELIFETVSYG